MSYVIDMVQSIIDEKQPGNWKYSLGITLKIRHYFGCKEILEKLIEKTSLPSHEPARPDICRAEAEAWHVQSLPGKHSDLRQDCLIMWVLVIK